MTPDGYGKAFEGMARLAMFGAACAVAISVGAVIGVPLLLWWLWRHVTVAWH